MSALSLGAVYARVARLRRSWYERRPQSRRRLCRPVVSIGNLAVGGSGKTPVVAAVARLLAASGHTPAVLSRGYARRDAGRGVVVVSDASRVLEPVGRSGDEPQMLARQLPGVPVLVSVDRYEAGRVAEERLGATIHLLDDGFQHLRLARDVDVLLVSPDDLDDTVLPTGRLRESLETARVAHAVLVPGSAADAARVARALEVTTVFSVSSQYGPLRWAEGGQEPPPARRVYAVAAIARPERFFSALQSRGMDVAGRLTFRDHHWFTGADVARATEAARACGAALIVTTEKDAVRLPAGTPWAVLPMSVTIEPAEAFAAWLRERL